MSDEDAAWWAKPRFMVAAVVVVSLLAVAGAIATAALIRAQTAAPITMGSPTPTPSPISPSPSPTPTIDPAGVVAFGGECENALTDAESSAITGMPMALAQFRWKSGSMEVIGGIDCLWMSSEEYVAGLTNIYAYPEGVVSPAVREAVVPGCSPAQWDAKKTICSATGVVDGTWLLVQTTGLAASGTDAAIIALYSQVASRLGSFPAPAPATRTTEWWALPDCAALVDQIDPAVLGFERVELGEVWTDDSSASHPISIPTLAGAVSSCGLQFSAGSGDSAAGELVYVSVVPGGGVTFPTAAGAEHSQPVAVPGAQAAVIAPGLDRYEGSASEIVVTDGVNTLMVTRDWIADPATAAALAAAVLALMHP